MRYKPEIFQFAPVNTSEPNSCSPPEPAPDWTGIIITGPTCVEVDRAMADNMIVPVCGVYQAEMLSLIDTKPIRVVVKNLQSGHVESGYLVDMDESPSAPLPFPEDPLGPSSLADMIIASYFNPDIFNVVRFAVMSTVYEVYVEYAGMKSNTLRIEVSVKL